MNRLRQLFCVEEWNVGTAPLPPDLLSGELAPITWRASTRRSSFVADPFLWLQDPEPRVLLEEFDYWTGRGRIRSASVRGLLGGEPLRDEIEAPQHLSYPFVFRAGGRWYCVPESTETRRVDLYEWHADARAWHRKSALIENVRAYDPTVLVYQNRWYLFATLKDDGPHSKLRLWWSDSLHGPWHEHPRNPVRIAADQVRGAGAVIQIAGRLYRPSQDCRRGYGSGLILNRIDTLSPSEYSETPVREWRAAPDSRFSAGMHTLTVGPGFVLVDGKRWRFSLLAPVWKSWWRLLAALRRAARSSAAAWFRR